MSKTTVEINEVTVDDMYETEIGEEDYGFILGPNGELKSVFMPEVVPFKQPKNIQKILTFKVKYNSALTLFKKTNNKYIEKTVHVLKCNGYTKL